uniref:Large ribosomal subunit protein mL52 n=1 Tax=Panagrolaimus sp. JU765 TaxID=591449 RepID=A0AC34R009_9BILA
MLKRWRSAHRTVALISTRPQSSVVAEDVADKPVPTLKGKAQFWEKPIYTGPFVNPLHRGPDYSVVDGVRLLATSKAEIDRLQKEVKLSRKVVELLNEIKMAEELFDQSCAKRKVLEEEKARWTPKAKAIEEIS